MVLRLVLAEDSSDRNRTATLRAITECKVAAAPADQIDRDKLVELSSGHRREESLH